MFLKHLTIKNLRCIENIELDISTKINILLGDNAQGKSTFLEAIFLISTSKSHRTSRDKEMLSIGKDVAYIMANVEREKRNALKLEISLSKTKNIKINDVKKSKLSDMLGEVNTVIFSSSDIEMIKGEPEARRHFLNVEISQIYPNYAINLGAYKKVLVQRNTLLKLIKENPNGNFANILDEYDHKIAFYGAEIIKKRFEYTKRLFTYAKEFFSQITQNNEDIEFKYSSHPKIENEEDFTFDKIREILQKRLSDRRHIDLKTFVTGTGPHRDEIDMLINNMSVRNFGSAGQQRSCAISLKMAEIKMIKEVSGEYPIVLLDDIMSELDKERRRTTITSVCKNCQTFITTTHLEDNETDIFKDAKTIYLKNGALK